jgi:hypothetical protein
VSVIGFAASTACGLPSLIRQAKRKASWVLTSVKALFYLSGFIINPKNLDNQLDAIVEEVFVNGQQQDVWCRSKKPITDPALYTVATSFNTNGDTPSCYNLYQARMAPRNLLRDCGPNGQTQSEACCLCM